MIVFGDWGTTNLRVWLVEDDGQVINTYRSDCGYKKASDIGFEKVLNEALQELQAPGDAPIVIGGMAGAKHGWYDVPYCPSPAGIEEIVENSIQIKERKRAWIVGGVYEKLDDGYEVIRGEEVQLVGIMDKYPEAQTVCLPGTHSKWVNVANGKIVNLATYMTGELFDIISKQSLINKQIESQEFVESAFKKGLQKAQILKPFTNQLFQLRTNYLFEEITGQEMFSYLSGFMIGQELKQISGLQKGDSVILCGSEKLNSVYATALKEFDLNPVAVDADEVTIHGFMKIYGKLK